MWTVQITKMLERSIGRFGVIIKNLESKEVLFSSNSDMVFPSASIIKLPILLALLDEAEAGRINLNEEAAAPEGSFVGGAGLFMHMTKGLPLTWRDHAIFMIALSDNDSTNILISRLGMELINEKSKKIGMKDTIIARKMMDFKAKEQGRDNYTTCGDTLTLFEHFYDNNTKYSDALHILKQQQNNKLLAGLLDTDSFEFAHKAGDLPHIRHDVGIMYLREPVFVAFMSAGLSSVADGQRLAQELGLLIYENYKM